MIQVFQQTYHAVATFLRAAFRQADTYEEVPLVEAFRATAAKHLVSCAVESSEADVGGTSNSYTQRYHCARVGEGDPNGEGSFRCLLTKATPHVARGGGAAAGSQRR